MTRIGKIASIALGLMCLTLAASAQKAHFSTSVNKSTVRVGERFRLTLSISQGKGTITRPNLNNFNIISGPNSSQSVQIINGQMTSTQSYIFDLSAKKEGTFLISGASATIDGKKHTAKPITIKVVKDNVPKPSQGQQNSQMKGDVIASILFDKTNVFEGEQVIASYVLYSRYNNLQIEEIKFPTINGFWTKEIKRKNEGWENRFEVINGKRYRMAILKQEVLFPVQSGEIKIDQYTAACVVNRTFFNAGQRISVKSRAVTLNVKALPSGKPDGFNGQVGKLSQKVEIDKTTLKANDAITMKVRISGKGNLTLIKKPEIEFPADFEVYDPKIKDNITVNAGGVSGSREFEYLIIPRHAGDYNIPKIPFAYFDTGKKRYVSQGHEEIKITVEKGDGQEGTSYTPYAKEDVKILDQDIRYIRTDKFALKPAGTSSFFTAGHFVGMSLPLVIFLAFVLVRRRQQELRGDVAGMKRRKANNMAKRRLKDAHTKLQAGDSMGFYESLFKALFGYFSDKLNIDVAQLNIASIVNHLSEQGFSDEVVNDVKATIERCEMARFAPVSDISEQEVYDNTIEIIGKVEEGIK